MKTLPLSSARLLLGAAKSQSGDRVEETWHHLNGTMSLDARRPGTRLQVFEGLLWVTQEGDAEDYLIGAGESFVATRPGRLVVQSLAAKSRFVSAEKQA